MSSHARNGDYKIQNEMPTRPTAELKHSLPQLRGICKRWSSFVRTSRVCLQGERMWWVVVKNVFSFIIRPCGNCL